MSDNAKKPDELLGMLTDEQREAARALKTPEEMLEFAKAGGIELTPEQLESISGGHWYNGQGGYA